jgi:hypothetical protein
MKMKASLPGLSAFMALAAFASLALTACGTDAENPRTVSGGAYSNTDIGLEITFPSAWQILTDQKFGAVSADVAAYGPAVGIFSPNVNVIFASHSGTTVLSEMLASIKPQLQARFADMSAYHDTVYVIGGSQVGELQYESSVNGNLMHFMQLIYVKNNLDVVCTFTDTAPDFPVNADIKSIKASINIR